MSNDNPCGPRAEIPLTFGNETFIATKFNLERLIELERWMRRAPFEQFQRVLDSQKNGTAFDLATQREMLAQAWDHSQDMLLFSFAGKRFWMQSIEGIVRALWISLRVRNPELTYDRVVAWLPPDKVDVCTDTLAELMGHSRENPTPPASEAPEPTIANPTHST